MARRDGRLPNQMRPLSAQPNALGRADGSARFGHDRTQVLCSVYGPRECKRARERVGAAAIEVVFRPRAGLPGPVEREFEQLLSQTLTHAVLTVLHPRTAVSVVVQVLADEGSLLSAAIGGACLALVHAGVPLRGMLSGCTIALLPDGAALLDPTAEEEAEAEAVVSLGYLLTRDATGKPQHELTLSHMRGTVSPAQYDECADTAMQATAMTNEFYRLALRRQTAPIDEPGVETAGGQGG